MTNQTKNTAKTVTDILVYVAIALLIVNLLLAFLPAVEVYQPSQKKTVLGVTTYEGWHTTHASMITFIFPIFVTVLPYICSIARLRSEKSVLMKFKNRTLTKPIRLFWLKFGSILNLVLIFSFYTQLLGDVSPYIKHGAYCRLTVWGIMNIICTVLFIVVLFILSFKSKSMFVMVKTEQIAMADIEESSEQIQKNEESEK